MSSPCANFYPEIEAEGAGSLELNAVGEGSCDDPLVISGELLISNEPGNTLEEKPSGLYSAPEILCTKHSFNITEPLEVTTPSECKEWIHIPAGSAVSFRASFLHIPAGGSNTVVNIIDQSSNIISTLTIPAGNQSGTFSVPNWVNGPSDAYLGYVVTNIGSTNPGCGLGIYFQACEPFSAYADPGSFLDNVDPTQLCNIIASNCGAELVPVDIDMYGRQVYRFYGNDGNWTDIAIGIGPESFSTDSDNIAQLGTDGGIYVPIQSLPPQARFYTATIGDNTSTMFHIAHNFGTRNVLIQVRENVNSNAEIVYADYYITNENSVQIDFRQPPALNQYVAMILAGPGV